MERFALDIPTDCPCEALFIVVSLAATFGQHGPRRDNCPREALFIVVKVVQVVFPTQQAVLDTTQTPLSLKYRMNLPNL